MRDRIIAFIALSPSIIAVAIFVYGFIGWTMYVSLSAWEGLVADFSWVGIQNYIKLLNNVRFQINMRNVLFFSVTFIITCLILSQFLAIILYQNIKHKNKFLNLFLLPLSVSSVVTGVVWRWLLNPGNKATGSVGINQLINKIGITHFSFGWYTNPTIYPGIKLGKIEWFIPIGMTAIILAAIWQISGYIVALYYTGLQDIPAEILGAARIDGANEFQIIRYMILPYLRSTTSSAIIILGYISLNTFDLVIAMTPGGGPAFVTEVPGLLMYRTVFQSHLYGEGAAIATIMFLISTIIFVPYLLKYFYKEMK